MLGKIILFFRELGLYKASMNAMKVDSTIR